MCEILLNFPDTQMQQSTVTVPNSAEHHWLSLLTRHAVCVRVRVCVCVCGGGGGGGGGRGERERPESKDYG